MNLGVIFKDENLGEEMIDISRGLHGLAPTVEGPGREEKFDHVPVVRTKRLWRGELRLNSLCELPTQRVEG